MVKKLIPVLVVIGIVACNSQDATNLKQVKDKMTTTEYKKRAG